MASRGCEASELVAGSWTARWPNASGRKLTLPPLFRCLQHPTSTVGCGCHLVGGSHSAGNHRYARVSADPARRQAGSGARICTPVGPELDPSGVLGGRAGTFRVGGTGPATGTGPRSAGLGCSGAGREQCGVPAAPVPPHPSQPLHLARRPASPTALLQQPRGAADPGQGDPTSTQQDICGNGQSRHQPSGKLLAHKSERIEKVMGARRWI